MELISKQAALEAVKGSLYAQNHIKELPVIDAVPLGCLELEKLDCGFSDQCDMGSSYSRERERACKNILEWYTTPSYQKCLEYAEKRGFIKKYSHEGAKE